MTFGASVMMLALVRRLAALAGAVRREQGVLAHQPQDALARDPDAVDHPQAGPDLAVPLAGPGRAREVGLDGGEQGRRRRRPASVRGAPARAGPARPAQPGERRRRRSAARPRPGRRARRRSAGRWRGRSPAAITADLLRAKGPLVRPMFARSSSISMLSSPIRCMAAASSSLAGSASRSLSAPSRPASAFWRHCSSLNMGRPSSRESSSAGSPRIRRNTDLALASRRSSAGPAPEGRGCRRNGRQRGGARPWTAWTGCARPR